MDNLVWIIVIISIIAVIWFIYKNSIPSHRSIRGPDLSTRSSLGFNGSLMAEKNPIINTEDSTKTISFTPVKDVTHIVDRIKALGATVEFYTLEGEGRLVKAHLPSGDVIAATSDNVPNAIVKLATKLGVSINEDVEVS